MSPTKTRPKRLTPLTEVECQDGYGWANTRWLRRMVYERDLPYSKVGGRLLIDLDDLDRLVERGRRKPASS